jgi:hypothetical protein
VRVSHVSDRSTFGDGQEGLLLSLSFPVSVRLICEGKRGPREPNILQFVVRLPDGALDMVDVMSETEVLTCKDFGSCKKRPNWLVGSETSSSGEEGSSRAHAKVNHGLQFSMSHLV